MKKPSFAVLGSMSVALSLAIPALGQGVPDYDFQWTTIGDVGNAPYQGPPTDANVNGRGTVNYEFRASRLEITTAQWMEFLNAFAPIDNSPLDYRGPLLWGAYRSEQLPNGHFTMSLDPLRANAGMLPIGGISWRDAARYCNWLTNNKQVSLAAISTGAYDTSTWGNQNPTTGAYPDDPHRMPGAKFFLPEISEYLKATHYDPNKFGPGQGGYWQYKTGEDSVPVPGAPGAGNTNAGYLPGGDPFAAWNIPLGSYTDIQTAYGLLDTSGGGKEWIEGWNEQVTVYGRIYLGTYAAMSPTAIPTFDAIGAVSGSDDLVNPQGFTSFRIYSVVPTPGTSVLLGVGILACSRKRSSES